MSSARSNGFKNPSFSYNRDFSVSSLLQNLKDNAATGSSSISNNEEEEEAPIENRRNEPVRSRPRKRKHEGIAEGEASCLSHQGYIQKIRTEMCCYSELVVAWDDAFINTFWTIEEKHLQWLGGDPNRNRRPR